MKSSLEPIINAALQEWPAMLNLSELKYQEGDRYSVPGLGHELEMIERKHMGHEDEVVQRELHWAIFTVIHSLAKTIRELKPSTIRADSVSQIFEQRLKSAIASHDPNWNANDFSLAQSYLQDAS
jgi:hypothetical protein